MAFLNWTQAMKVERRTRLEKTADRRPQKQNPHRVHEIAVAVAVAPVGVSTKKIF